MFNFIVLLIMKIRKVLVTEDELELLQSLRAEAQKQGTANASGNDGYNQKEPHPFAMLLNTPRKKYSQQPAYKVLRKAKRLYYSQVDKSVENKIRCIEIALASYIEMYPDKLRFEMDFRAERERLTDSSRFCKACEGLGLVAVNVADHIVFEGKGVVEKVLKEGLQVVGEKVHMFNAPLWKDTEELYTAKDGDAVAKPDVAEVEPAPKIDE